jgi:2-polyprenyl-6-methoxyphenol hydroxylase-like FAD-dependent oxidoreductase
MSRAVQVPVLIAGAGPAGLAAAITLARHGVESLVVERRREPPRLPRATAISMRSMELLRSFGLEQEIRAGGVEVAWYQCLCETLATAWAGDPRPVGVPSREQCAVLSPTSPACVPQDHLELVLRCHLLALGRTRMPLGAAVAGVAEEPDGVRVEVRDGRTGESRVVLARYVVAADGAHSTVRAALGIPMRGPDQLLQGVTALFHAPLWKLVGEHRYGLYGVTHEEAAGVFLPAGPGDRWVYGTDRDRAEGGEERMRELIRLGAGVPGLRPRIERVGTFGFAAQLAERFRDGRVFLAGDAAHRVTPRGGTGMNVAIHDGHDLGWKLAWVLRGWAGPELLDTYEAERRPVAEHNVARSADANGSTRAAEDELHVDLGGRIAHTWLPPAGGRRSTLDLVGPGLTLFTGPEPRPWEAAADHAGAPVPLAVRSLDAMTARALGVQGGGALLVRPDAMPAARLLPGDAALPALRAAVASVTADGALARAA